MSAKGYTEGTWKGIPHFKCDRCAFAVAGKTAKRDIGIHVASHFGLPEDAIEMPEDEGTAVLDFASDQAADAFMAVPEDQQEAVALALMDRKPSGLTGYTVADVKAAVTSEEG